MSRRGRPAFCRGRSLDIVPVSADRAGQPDDPAPRRGALRGRVARGLPPRPPAPRRRLGGPRLVLHSERRARCAARSEGRGYPRPAPAARLVRLNSQQLLRDPGGLECAARVLAGELVRGPAATRRDLVVLNALAVGVFRSDEHCSARHPSCDWCSLDSHPPQFCIGRALLAEEDGRLTADLRLERPDLPADAHDLAVSSPGLGCCSVGGPTSGRQAGGSGLLAWRGSARLPLFAALGDPVGHPQQADAGDQHEPTDQVTECGPTERSKPVEVTVVRVTGQQSGEHED